ncbi:fimbrial biogenesis chaperone [Flavobacterium hercynium]|uniref:BACON domain-containing protein n=1 Tax=Flavobacterium hercynium TaxID=387094 RepID=A0A226HBK8_9FLAO|nr:hypothetical protein [Flavobacterium hercynium]OXA91667.1 hypothetical protein B0A66_11030 [Flavobacterium hercynium]SMP27619.1 hypothetical protein SAMN06265346_110146 [Flavobacterium hercynium]
MKKITTLLLMSFFLLISCTNQEDGKWDDNIKLSQKEVTFDSESNTVTISTKDGRWWLNQVAINQELIDISKVDAIAKDFTITNAEFQIERKEGKQIIITMNKNTTGADRRLIVGVQNGNYYDGIVVNQSK